MKLRNGKVLNIYYCNQCYNNEQVNENNQYKQEFCKKMNTLMLKIRLKNSPIERAKEIIKMFDYIYKNIKNISKNVFGQGYDNLIKSIIQRSDVISNDCGVKIIELVSIENKFKEKEDIYKINVYLKCIYLLQKVKKHFI
jgi:heme oxygenase